MPLLIVHVVVDLPITLLMINPLCARLALRGEPLDQLAIRWWSRGLVRMFDITLMHSQRVVGFVAKSEIARWPVIGWLASRGGTIYHHRGNNDSLHGVMHEMVLRLQSGRAVGVFPEGGTSAGDSIRVFHARIFQPAVLAGVPAQPVALKYGAKGCAQTIIAFAPGESFLTNFLRLLGEPTRVAEVHFLEPVAASEDGRRRMADSCRERIIAAMGL